VLRGGWCICCVCLVCLWLLPLDRRSTLVPYTTLFRSRATGAWCSVTSATIRTVRRTPSPGSPPRTAAWWGSCRTPSTPPRRSPRSEEHTSELQSRFDLVCRLLLEKKKQHQRITETTHT